MTSLFQELRKDSSTSETKHHGKRVGFLNICLFTIQVIFIFFFNNYEFLP